MWRWFGLWLLVWAVPALGQTSDKARGEDVGLDPLAPYRSAAVERWEEEIQKLEALDDHEEDPADAVLLIGSSSIRRWNSMATDLAPYRTIGRGFGGSRYSDVAVFAERLLHPHRYRALVVFVGNDVTGKPDDRTPEQVEQFVRHILAVSQQHQPESPVLLIEITPTEKRFAVWPQIRQVNARLREIALTTANTSFVATAEHFLDPHGNPRSELFAEDRLHLNEDGYAVWANLIRQRLDDVLRRIEAFRAARSPQPATAAD
jgi:lysophospholipase L1-like esterase